MLHDDYKFLSILGEFQLIDLVFNIFTFNSPIFRIIIRISGRNSAMLAGKPNKDLNVNGRKISQSNLMVYVVIDLMKFWS